MTLFLKFTKVRVKKRLLNKLAYGVVTFGDVPPPVPLYAGPTGNRAMLANKEAAFAAGSRGDTPLPNRLVSGREGESLRNVSRGDRTPIELFLAGLADWGTAAKRLLG